MSLPASVDRALEALLSERDVTAAQLAALDEAIASLRKIGQPALPLGPAPARPPRRAGRRRAKAVPTPHDKAIGRPPRPRAKMAAPGSPARGAMASLRTRLEALVVAAGANGIKGPDAAAKCQVSRVTALRQLRHLEAAGTIHMTGWSRSARWFAGQKHARGLQ